MVDGVLERAGHRAVRLATASSLWRSSITDSSGTSTLLWSGLLTGTCRITACLDTLPNSLALMLEELEDVVNDISPQWLVKDVLIELNSLISEPASDKAVDWQVKRLLRVEGSLRPGLSHEHGLVRFRQAVLGCIELVQASLQFGELTCEASLSKRGQRKV